MKRFFRAAFLVALAACTRKPTTPAVSIATVSQRDIIIDAQANGVIEPITVIDVKSKASGVIVKMPVETGTRLRPGDLIVQIDTRDVQNQYDQAKAALDAAQVKLTTAEANKKRSEELLKARVITPQEFEQVTVDYETAKSSVVGAQAMLDQRKLALEDATVKAPQEGTVITKSVAEGTVIASASGSVSGGTTLIQMADLGIVRIRALFNESDIGNIHSGQPANVTVDAYPDRRFTGVVEKIEPQAVVQQNVTMFPVLVNLDNREALLKPGMNGSIAVLIDEHDGVIAIPNDAIKNPREAITTGAMLGLSADSVTKELVAQGYNPTASRGGFGGGNGRRGGGNGNGGGGNGGGNRGGGAGPGASGSAGSAGGDVVAAVQQGSMQGGAQGGGGFGQGGFGPQVSDADCKKIDDILKAHPKDKKQIDDLAAKLAALRPAGFGGFGGGGNRQPGDTTRRRSGGGFAGGGGFGNRQPGDSTRRGGGFGNRQPGDSTRRGGGRGSPEMQAISEQLRTIETALNIDPRTAGACRRRQNGGASQMAGGSRQAGGQGGQGAQGGRGGQLTPANELGQRPARPRTGLVFTSDSSKTVFHPRIVQLGQGNLDYTEVVSGLKVGERVVMLGALALQAQRQQQQDRARQNASPLGGQPGGPGPGGGGPRGGGGGRGG